MTTIPLETPSVSNPHTLEVRERMSAIRTELERIRGFAHPAKGARRRINFTASLPDTVLEAVAVAIEASEPLGAAAQVTPNDLRDAIAFERAYRSLADDLEVQANAVRFAIATRRSDAGRLALQTYAIAKGMNRSADHQVLVPHLAVIRKALTRKRKKGADVPPEAEATPDAAAGGTR